MTNDLLQGYQDAGLSDDEMFDEAGALRDDYRELGEILQGWSLEDHLEREERADLALLSAGITFNVYSEEEGTERIFPFSLIPRVIGAQEWAARRSRAETASASAQSCFSSTSTVRNASSRIRVVPEEIVLSSPGYQPEMAGFQPPARHLRPHRRLRSRPWTNSAAWWCSRTISELRRASRTCSRTEP